MNAPGKGFPLAVGSGFPASLGRTADLLYDVRELRRAMQREVDALEEREKEVEDFMVQQFSASDPGAVGAHHIGKLLTSRKPIIKVWADFAQWLVTYGATDCVQHRLNEAALMERIEAAKMTPPGIEMATFKKISLTKV